MGLKTIRFILNLTELILLISFLFTAYKTVKGSKQLKKIKDKNNTFPHKTKTETEFTNFSYMLLGAFFALILFTMFNVVVEYDKNFVMIILIAISAIIDECLYMIFMKKRGIDQKIYIDYKKIFYWFFAMVDIELLMIIIAYM